jgi:hypothetical protein
MRPSSVMARFCARTSATKVLIPTPYQILSIVFNQFQNAIDFATAKPATALQSHRIEPKLCDVVVSLNVNMLGLIAITGVKVKPIRSYS